MTDELENKLAVYAEQLGMLGAELDRQRALFSSRQSASNARAALLIGSATIASGVQMGGTTSGWQVLAVTASLVAALLGVISLWPRGGREVSVDSYIDTLYDLGPRRTELDLLNAKSTAHAQDEEALLKRHSALRVGFAFLVLAVAFTGMQAAALSIF